MKLFATRKTTDALRMEWISQGRAGKAGGFRLFGVTFGFVIFDN